MSLSVSSNNASPSSNLKSSNDSASAKDAVTTSEEPGFFDTLKSAISGENADKKQSVDGSSAKKGTSEKSVADSGSLSSDASESVTDGEDEIARASSENKGFESNGKSESADSVNQNVKTQTESEEVSSLDVKKMALASATVASEEGVSATNSGNLPATSQGKSSGHADTSAQATMDESSQLLNRLNESNKALQTPPLESAAGVAVATAKVNETTDATQASDDAAVLAAFAVESGQSMPVESATGQTLPAEALSSTAIASATALSTTAASPPTSTSSIGVGQANSTLSQSAGVAGLAVADGSVKSDGANSQIAWSQTDGSSDAKLEGKAAILAAGAALDKSTLDKQAASASNGLNAVPTPLSQPNSQQAQPFHSAHHGTAAASNDGASAPAAGTPAAGTLAAASMLAGKETPSASPVTSGVAPPNAMGVGQTNLKGLKPSPASSNEPLNGLNPAATAGTALGTQALRGEQPQATTNVQSPMVLTKENASDQVSERIQMMMAKNLKQVDIRLDPPELGRMQIRMTLNSDTATVHFTVQNQQTREMVDQSMPRLREMLSQQGIQLADTSVQQQGSGQQQRHASADAHNQGSSGAGQSHGDVDALEEGVSMNLNIAKKEDGISYYA
ncbi:flagellar hook-length control protein FliK [Vibrio sp. ZSDZ65]|uniref:Flagellar hook-length control protein FliK n=1 Tax=Vibrio qingdaonensis TaxID=2829491 RepID=A0A9X3HXV3_9VIBR|nr:flagellar hook-length control protein FliK [Vibrio qingdaonensis]MCW8347648.1 flagellar hook-length control protein FliK [Vibrio qingdaonensis]